MIEYTVPMVIETTLRGERAFDIYSGCCRSGSSSSVAAGRRRRQRS